MASASVTLLTDQLESVIAEWIVKTVGIEGPVAHRAHWGWTPGKGPVLVRMDVESVPNVVPLRKGQSRG